MLLCPLTWCLATLTPEHWQHLVGDNDQSKLGRLIRHNACPPGQKLTCSNTDNDVPASRVSNITEYLVHDIRMSVGGHVGVTAHVPDVNTCHNYCLAKSDCLYWTWRGETSDNKSFLLPRETRVVRRQGSASGSVSRDLNCARPLPLVSIGPKYREEAGVTQCDCVLDHIYKVSEENCSGTIAVSGKRVGDTPH